MKKRIISGALIFAAIGIVFGIILIVINPNWLIDVFFILFGIITLISSAPSLVMSLSKIKNRGAIFDIIISAISVAMGVLLIILRSSLLLIIVGVYLIVLPAIRIIFSNERKIKLRSETPRIIFGLIILILTPATFFNVLFDVAGWIVIGLTIIYAGIAIISSIIHDRNDKKFTTSKMYVDTDGNGKVDAVFIDKTGDGVFDKIIKIPEIEDKENK